MRRRHLRLAPVAVLIVAASAACSTPEAVVEASPTTTTSTTLEPPPTVTTAPKPPGPPLIPVEEGHSLTATPKVNGIQGYLAPDGEPAGFVTDNYYEIPTTLAVVDQVPGWVQVRTPYRPNSSTSWVRAEDLTFGSTPWRVVIDLSETTLRLYDKGREILAAPVGIGTDATPTATGEFFVTHIQAPTSSEYGPFVMITSGHSNVIFYWEGFPDGILAIHGPIGSDELIGTTGAKMSNGCIRMHVEDQEKLAVVTPGSPVTVQP